MLFQLYWLYPISVYMEKSIPQNLVSGYFDSWIWFNKNSLDIQVSKFITFESRKTWCITTAICPGFFRLRRYMDIQISGHRILGMSVYHFFQIPRYMDTIIKWSFFLDTWGKLLNAKLGKEVIWGWQYVTEMVGVKQDFFWGPPGGCKSELELVPDVLWSPAPVPEPAFLLLFAEAATCKNLTNFISTQKYGGLWRAIVLP